MKILTFLIIVLSISPSYAKVYKCLVNEQTHYQEVPCSEQNSHGGEIDVLPNTVSTKELRQYIEQDKIPKKQRRKKEKKAQKARRKRMDKEIKAYAKHREKVNKKKAAERKKKKKKNTKRERR